MSVNYKPYKCLHCGWVHSAIPLAAAQEQVARVNDWHASRGEPTTESTARYFHCFKCGAPSADFVLALPGDAPTGSTMQGVVVPGVFDG